MSELGSEEIVVWERLRATRPEFFSPFFSARFAKAVQMCRGDALVAIIQQGNEIIGFLPFHKLGKVAYPVGRCFNDAHNIIAAAETQFDWYWLLDQMDVKAFDYHAMVGFDASTLGDEHCIGRIRSFSCSLGDDPEAYLKRLGKQHKTIGRQPQKTRKMQREVGDVTLEVDCQDMALLDQTIQWKRNQYQRTNILDLFTPQWTQDLCRTFFASEELQSVTGNARGLLSVLRSGDHVVAAHFGILENDVLHYWFPAYDPAFSKYSPGTAMFRHIIGAAPELGIRVLDMGYGEQPYKLKQTDLTSEVAFGCVSRSRLYRYYRSAETAAISAIKKTPMKETLKKVWRKFQPTAGISKLR